MRNIALLARRELGAYLRSPMGYVIVAIVLFLQGLFFNVRVLGGTPKFSAEVLQLFFATATFFSAVAAIMLSMRLLAEERQLGTLTLLLTSPIKDFEIVLGKFFSALVFFLAMTLISIYMPLLIFVNGKVSFGHILGGYFGLTLLGMSTIAIGLFASAVSPNQLVAAVAGVSITAAFWVLYWGTPVMDAPVRDLVAFLSPWKHLAWQNGVIHTRDVFYFLSVTYFFLLLTTQMLQARRWR
jgi:ABC-2 type transport system permease protein